MSLFNTLIELHSDEYRRLEDFLTEIVAHVLASDSQLTLSWLRELGISQIDEAEEVVVTTQKAFEPIDGIHISGSRPDIYIRVRSGLRIEAVFIESKVGSKAGYKQLSKYVDHLRELPGVHRRSLLFITRDYEPHADMSDNTVHFYQRRWSDFYRFLSRLKSSNETIRELLQFMKEHNMSQSNRFTPIELLALTNHYRARSLMNATMWEDVLKKFIKVCGATSSAARAIGQLRLHNRYVMSAGHGGNQIEFLLGYWFPDEQISESPVVGMDINLNPRATDRPAIAKAMMKFSEASKGKARQWENWDLGNDHKWAGIGCSKNLEEFFASEDHVAAITKWFIELLDDAAAFRKQYPKLPWSVRATEASEED